MKDYQSDQPYKQGKRIIVSIIGIGAIIAIATAVLWFSEWGQITECRYRFSKLEKSFTDKDWNRMISRWMGGIDTWPWGVTSKKWAINDKPVPVDKWKNISNSNIADHMKIAEGWAEKINNPTIKSEVYRKLADVYGRRLGDRASASIYLRKWISTAKSISDEGSRQTAFLDIIQIAGGLNEPGSGLVLLEEIASEMRRLNSGIARGYGFRFLAEAAGQMGSGEKVAAYIHEACKSGDFSNDICLRPIPPEAAVFLIGDDRSSGDYFSKSLSYAKSNSYGFDRACYLGELAKTAALAFDKSTSLNYMNQIKVEFIAAMDATSKQTLIEKMSEAVCALTDRDLSLSFLKSLYEETQKINSPWPRSMAYQAIAGAAHLLGDDRASFSYFIIAAESALQNDAPKKIGWNVSNFLLDKAEEIGFDLKKYDLMAKLDVAASQIESASKFGNAGEERFSVYMHFARIAERIGEKEKGRQYLSKAKIVLTEISLPNSMHNDMLDMAITAKKLGELALACDLGMKAFDMAKLESQKSPLRSLCISTVAGVARLYAGIGDIRYACSLAESEGFTVEDKAEIICSVMAEYSKNQYRRIKSG